MRTLRSILKDSGLAFFNQSPFSVFERLTAESVAVEDASLVLLALLNHAHTMAVNAESTEEAVAEHFREHCGLTEEAAAWLANICLAAFNGRRQKEVWAESNAQFQEFCSRTWEMHWEGQSRWEKDAVYVDCDGSAQATFKIVEPARARQSFEALLQKHTQVSSQMIFEHLEAQLAEMADQAFEDYCSYDDYYPPVAEDFGENFASVAEEFAKQHGMQLTDYTFEGNTSDYEPCD